MKKAEAVLPEANRAKATVQVKVKVENPDEQLRPEMNARVNFLADAKPADGQAAISRALIPKAAVVHKDNSDVVFVVKGSKVEQRVVRLGEESGDSYYVIEGLSGGEMVAVDGAANLRDGDRVKINGQ